MIYKYMRQLFYVAEQRSFAYISRTTGIPYRTVLAMRSGKIKLTSEFTRSMRNMYQRESYGRLRETGFSTYEARRWSWYTPEKVVIKTFSLKARIAELATGAVAAKLESLGIPTSKGAIDDLFDDMYERVRVGISKSLHTTEELMEDFESP
ncbi:hypothetical protein ES703_124768 [subsurface metagenome]